MPEHESLGLESGTVVMGPYDARWPMLFRDAAFELDQEVGDRILGVHHIGSTSVPGMCSKPILDILVSVPGLERSLGLVPDLEGLGYEFRPDEDILDRHFFRRLRGTARTHHLSLAEPSSQHHRVTLAFRDVLRGDAQIAREYADFKLELASRFPKDRPAYMAGKAEFILGVTTG